MWGKVSRIVTRELGHFAPKSNLISTTNDKNSLFTDLVVFSGKHAKGKLGASKRKYYAG